MSSNKDMLGPVVRALVGVPDSRLGTVADIANRFSGDRGEEWNARIAAVLREGLVVPASIVGFERNKHGHIVLTVTGLDLSGADEIARLEKAEFRVSDYAKSCFKSAKADGYDKNHRLAAGQTYQIALVFGKEIEKDSDRTTAGLTTFAGKFGYQKPLGGIIPRIRELVSDKQMEDMDIWYIAGLHEPIKDSDGLPRVLYAHRDDDGRWVDSCWDNPSHRWSTDGAFAFLVPAS